ncbi:hypothetical protein CRE_20988 [Caenorhabditis remanei]|uniref:Uncharacterized protein n=1 Tax=Caenorhabditis remanei TaxID=31234 RepID=E3NJ09_CAERE|nr:hypothetical protein CRE_20988 [Caenorhabditis remanei]
MFDDLEIPVAEVVEIDDGDEMAEQGNDGMMELDDDVGGEVAIMMAIEAHNVDIRIAAEAAAAQREAEPQLQELRRRHLPGRYPMVVRARVGGPWGDGRPLLENDYGIDQEQRRRDPPLDEEIEEMPRLPFQLPKDARDNL